MSFFSFIKEVADNLWGPPMLVAILGTGLYFSLRLKGVQFTRFFPALKAFARSGESAGSSNITPFQALMSALSGMIGNGNIAGVATAIVMGGPGAVFWMWVSSVVLMATMYSESLLGIMFRKKGRDGTWLGGPMVYIREGLGWKWLAVAFALVMALKTLFATTSIQANSMSIALNSQFGIPQIASCAVIAFLTWIVIIGGLRSIARVAQVLTPFMTIAYLLTALVVLVINFDKLPAAFADIFRYAFSAHGAAGGFAGASVLMALRYGAARGAYSNEAGTGSVPIMHATARCDDPRQQSLIAMLGVFIDTLVICTITALVILTAGKWTGGLNSTALASESFMTGLGFGDWIVLGASLLFGYSTLITWCFYGEQCAAFVFGDSVKRWYKWLFCLAILIGAASTAEKIWCFGDLLNGLTVLINLVGVVALSRLLSNRPSVAKLQD